MSARPLGALHVLSSDAGAERRTNLLDREPGGTKALAVWQAESAARAPVMAREIVICDMKRDILGGDRLSK